MSREKYLGSLGGREIKSVMLQRCDNIFLNLQKENSMNKYLRQNHRQSSDYKAFKNVSDCYMSQVYNQKEDSQRYIPSSYMKDNFDDIIQDKIKGIVVKHVQKYVKNFFEKHKSGLQVFFRNEIIALKMQMESMRKEYEEMFLTFQDIIKKNIQGAKQKPKKQQKYVKNIDFSEFQKNIRSQIFEMSLKTQNLSKKIQKINQNTFKVEQKVQPVLLKYDESSEIRLQDLQVVVDIFNHNFIEIDAKFKELFTKLT